MYTLEIKSSFAKNISKIKTSNPKIYIKIPELLNRLIEWPPFEYYYNTHKLK